MFALLMACSVVKDVRCFAMMNDCSSSLFCRNFKSSTCILTQIKHKG